MVRIVCTGIAVWDEIFSVPNIPDRPAKFFADDYRGIGGGPASTASVAAVAMGAEALIWARVGDDPVAEQIVSELAGLGVDVSAMSIGSRVLARAFRPWWSIRPGNA